MTTPSNEDDAPKDDASKEKGDAPAKADAKSDAKTPRSTRSLLLNAGMLIVSLAIGLVFLELGLRLYFYHSFSIIEPAAEEGTGGVFSPHPTRGWALTPGATSSEQTLDYTSNVVINDKGLRDVPHDYEAKPGVFRIVVLGDSFMFASQVEMNEMLASVVGEKLKDKNVETINLGVVGYGTYQEYLSLQEEGLKYKPDLVLLGFFPGNDLSDNTRAIGESFKGKNFPMVYGRPYAALDESGELVTTAPDYERYKAWFEAGVKASAEAQANRGFFDKTITAKLFGMKVASVKTRDRTDPNLFYAPYLASYEESLSVDNLKTADYDKLMNDAWASTLRVVLDTRKLAEENGAKFAMFIVPRELQVEKSYQESEQKRYPLLKFDYEKPNKLLVEFGEKTGTPVIDLLPAFRSAEAATDAPLFGQNQDHHWNAAGHRVGGEEVAAALERLKLVPPDVTARAN